MDEKKQFQQQPQRIKINATKVLLSGLLVAVILYGLFILINERSDEVSESDILEADFSKNCEAGNWINFSENTNKLNEIYEGKLISDEEENVISEDKSRIFAVSEEYSLDYFIGKKVGIEGNKEDNDKIKVQRIRCVGEETKPENVKFRRSLMKYVDDNMNSIAIEKPQKGEWMAEEFYFVNNENFYVYYSSYEEDDEDYEENRLLLLRSQKKDSPYDLKQLAYIIPSSEEDEEAEVKFGEDIYEDQKDIIIYEYDYDEEEWLLAE